MRLLGTAVVAVAVTSLLWTSGMAAGQATQPSERRNLIGAWELVFLQDHRPNGDVLDWMGKKPSGTLIYSPDGRMSVQIMRDPRPAVVSSMWSSDGRDLLPSASANEIRDAYTMVITPETSPSAMLLLIFSMMLVSASFWLFFVYTLDRPTIRECIERSQQTVNRIFGALLLLLGMRVASMPR